MKTIRFLFLLIITVSLGVALNSKIGQVPPLGKLLSPWHGYLQNIENPSETSNYKISNEELRAEVKVYFDEIGIPHIYAQNDHDMYYAQGYLTAKDRLWQMDFFSRVVMGRLSEVLGMKTIHFDKLNRRIGLKKMTFQSWEVAKSDPELHTALTSFSDGVNAYIDDLSYSDYPIEFKLLDYKPETWSPVKSCLAYAMLSNTLSRSEADLENTNALVIFGKEMYDLMFPEQLGNLDPVIPSTVKWDFAPLSSNQTHQISVTKTKKTIDKPNPLYGSNNFVVSGDKTKNGNVLFANEPDLQLTQPSIWYAIHQNKPEHNTMGVTVPGTPLILIGFNDSIAWGVTNSPRDQVDWYKIKFRDQSRNEYWYNNQWFKSEKVIEEIKIRGEKSQFDTIIYVHHGPVVYDRSFFGENEKNNYAMKWIAHDPGHTLSGMYKINRSKNYEAFEEALRDFTGPPQNFLFGSSKGDIAVNLPGKFPIKPEGMGKFLLEGSQLDQEWTKLIPFEQRLWLMNPKQGFLSSANQHPTNDEYPYYIYDHNYEYFRGRRINDRLRVLNYIEPKDLMKLQNDNFNYHAFESLPAMLDSLDTLSFDSSKFEYFNALQHWDYFNEAELEEPTLYQVWWDILYEKIWDEYDTVNIRVKKPHRYITTHLLQNEPSLPFFDILNTPIRENVNQLYQDSFNEAVDSLEKWSESNGNNISWYNYKNTRIRHLLRLEPFSKDKVIIGGGPGIVNAAGKSAGPSWRMVVELDPEGTKAWAVYPGSQTGNPGNTDYGNMIDKWAKGEYYELLFGDDISQSEKVNYTLTFKP